MKWMPDSRDALAIYAAVAGLLLGTGVVWGLHQYAGIKDSAILIALLLVPLLIYGVGSGRLKEFSAPGGWGGKFAEVANRPVDVAQSLLDLSNAQMEEIPKKGIEELKQSIGQIKDGRPIVMTLVHGQANYYQPDAVRGALLALGSFRNFKFVVFLDPDRKVVGYLPSWALRSTLERDGAGVSAGDTLIQAVNAGDTPQVRSFPGMLTEYLSPQSTNAQALETMERLNLEAMLMVDRAGKLLGVAERDRILSRMVLALAKGSTEKHPAT